MNFKNLTKPYLIGEIGINHNGDIQIAKKLIDAGFATSWDCVKFQKRNPEIAVPEHQKSVMRDTPWGRMSYLEYKYKVEFNREQYDYIDRYCKEKPIDWTASVWDMDSLMFLQHYNIPFIKVASAHMTNHELLIETCKTGIPILMSTGMSTLKEVDDAVNLLENHSKSYAIMHTNSSYPAKAEELNLKLIPFYIDRYKCPVGYSGHEYGLNPSSVAIALGATIIERHITLDKNMWGTDQSSSVEIMGMDMLRKRIDNTQISLGFPEKKINFSEIPIRKKLSNNT